MTEDAEINRRITSFTRAFRWKRVAEAAFNAVAGLVTAPRYVFLRRDGRPDRILVVQRVLRIGDTLVARPALTALRRTFPDARLAVVCQPALAPLCRADGLIDAVLVDGGDSRRLAVDVKEWRPGRAYVFAYDRQSPWLAASSGAAATRGYDYVGRAFPLTERRPLPPRVNVPGFAYPPETPPVHAAAIWTALVDAPAPTSYPPLEPGDEARRAAAAWLEGVGFASARPLVIVHPGAANRSYYWPEERWGALMAAIAARSAAAFVVSGGPGERTMAERVAAAAGARAASAAGRLSIPAMCALVAASDLVVAVDTAAVHIAATMGTPVVGLYGPGDETMWAPLGVPHRVIAGAAPCRVCKNPTCFQVRHYCMDAIAADDVANAALGLLGARGY